MVVLYLQYKGDDLMSKFINNIVIGIDVSKDFHYIAILAPDGSLFKQPFKIFNTVEGFKNLLIQIKKAEEEFNTTCAIFMESTGVYHSQLFRFLKNLISETFIINPLITNSIKNKNIRKAKTDKRDSISIAKLGKYEDIKCSNYHDSIIYDLKSLVREHIKLVETASIYKHKLVSDIHLVLPNYTNAFNEPFCTTSLSILVNYPTPQDILNASKEDIIMDIKSYSNHSLDWATKKYNQLIKIAEDAIIIGINSSSLFYKISQNISLLNTINIKIKEIKKELKSFVNSDTFPATLRESIKLIDSIPGFDFMTAVTLLAEIGDYTRFKKPKHLVAYLGIDPSVSQSGKFSSTNNRMSKRGSQPARKALYTAALVSVRKKPNGELFNQVLHDYYKSKPDKEKKVLLGSIMHKLVNYIFSVLRDRTPFEIRNPKIHAQMYLHNHSKKIA